MIRSFEVEANQDRFVYTIVTDIILLDLTLVHAVTHHRVLVRRVTHRVPAVILHVPRAVRRLLNVILHLHLILILDDVFVLINKI